jgi:hypothetical protein
MRLKHTVSGILGAGPKPAAIHLDGHYFRRVGRSGSTARRWLCQQPLGLLLFPSCDLLLKLLLHLLARVLRESMDLPLVHRPFQQLAQTGRRNSARFMVAIGPADLPPSPRRDAMTI